MAGQPGSGTRVVLGVVAVTLLVGAWLFAGSKGAIGERAPAAGRVTVSVAGNSTDVPQPPPPLLSTASPATAASPPTAASPATEAATEAATPRTSEGSTPIQSVSTPAQAAAPATQQQVAPGGEQTGPFGNPLPGAPPAAPTTTATTAAPPRVTASPDAADVYAPVEVSHAPTPAPFARPTPPPGAPEDPANCSTGPESGAARQQAAGKLPEGCPADFRCRTYPEHFPELRTQVLGDQEPAKFCFENALRQTNRPSDNCHLVEVLAQSLFKGKQNGVFFEVGAFDGTDGSNSLYLERVQGWTGFMVEGSNRFIGRAKKSRHHPPQNHVVYGALCSAADAALGKLVSFDDTGYGTGGVASQLNAEFLAKRRADGKAYATSVVKCVEGSALARSFNISHVDFWSLSVSGAELTAARAWDFEAVPVGAMAIELDGTNTTKDELVRQHVRQHGGMKFLMKIDGDEVFFNPKHVTPQAPLAGCGW